MKELTKEELELGKWTLEISLKYAHSLFTQIKHRNLTTNLLQIPFTTNLY